MTVEIVHTNIINIIAPTVITDNGLIVAICTHPTIARYPGGPLNGKAWPSLLAEIDGAMVT